MTYCTENTKTVKFEGTTMTVDVSVSTSPSGIKECSIRAQLPYYPHLVKARPSIIDRIKCAYKVLTAPSDGCMSASICTTDIQSIRHAISSYLDAVTYQCD